MRYSLREVRRGMTLAGLWWLITACVTVNIYFPAAAAEDAADQIIQDVWGRPDADQPAPAPHSGRGDVLSERRLALGEGLFNILVPAVQAQQADIHIDTPAINRIKREMAARHSQLEPYYNNGTVGLTRDGLLTVRDLNAIPLAQRSTVNRLVAEENRDRNALYREIAIANNHPQWESDIRATFARRWIENARSGWWYQDVTGTWRQKP